ncbi:efflux RND transporter periplasmic adaptor subunit [Salinisphaera hydrothermalis]|uniref:efflux RND transporter periplasmic adaptor subunit n=1 Tax=Salinisphaera hydrothermalis TaxID=563188 RepID=UPI00333FA4AB
MSSALWAATQPSALVQTAAVKRQHVNQTINAFGEVRPDPQSQITRDAAYAAFVEQLDVTLGQPVHKGDPLLTLRTAPAARAKYLSAKAQVRFAQKSLARKKKLLKQRLATHADVDAAEQALATARTALATQKALGTGDPTRVIKAPFSGIVSQLPVQPGNEVQTGTRLFQLAKRDSLQVALGIEPDEASRVKKGMSIRVIPLFAGGNGVATQVARVNAVVDPSTRLVNIVVRLSGQQAQPFLPGMRVKGVLTLASQSQLTVPRSAVLHDNHGDYVFIVHNGTAHRVNVKTGAENDGRLGVNGALKAGQQVVVKGNYELSDGMAVRSRS